MFTRKYSFLSVGLHLAIMATFRSRSRDLFSLLLTDVVIGLLLNVTHYMPFILPDAPHRTDYSQSEGDKKKLHFTIKNFFPKRLSRNQESINQFIHVNTWDGVAPIIRAQGSCMKRMTKYIMDFLYRFPAFDKQLFQPLNLYWLLLSRVFCSPWRTSRLPWFLRFPE